MRVACTLLLILMCGITEGNASEVTAAGVAPVIGQNIAQARKAALEEAKRSAVEQVLGSYVESRTQVSEFALASDKIYSSVKGRIDQYRITVDEVQGGDLYRIEIVATFEDDVLLSETEQMLKKYHWHKKPRLLVEVSGTGDASSRQVALQLQQGLEKKFRGQGFDVFDAASGERNGAGFLLRGEALVSSRESDYQGMALSSNELSVTASLMRIGSGQIISSSSFSGSKAGANQARAFKSLNGDAVKKLYREISRQVNEEWLSHQARGSDIVLQLSGQGVSGRISTIKTELGKLLRGVRSISTDTASDRSAVLSVVYVGWPEQLYDELSLAVGKNKQLGLSIDGIRGNTVQISVL
jgi:hypothetical protein